MTIRRFLVGYKPTDVVRAENALLAQETHFVRLFESEIQFLMEEQRIVLQRIEELEKERERLVETERELLKGNRRE